MTDIRTALHSALAFPITPFDANGRVDLDAVRLNASFVANSRCGAIVAPSGTGEIFALTPEESTDIVRATVEVAGETPVIAPAGFGPVLGARMAAEAEAAGAAAIMVVAPYYAKPSADGLVEYYKQIACPFFRTLAMLPSSPRRFWRSSATNCHRSLPSRMVAPMFASLRNYVIT